MSVDQLDIQDIRQTCSSSQDSESPGDPPTLNATIASLQAIGIPDVQFAMDGVTGIAKLEYLRPLSMFTWAV